MFFPPVVKMTETVEFLSLPMAVNILELWSKLKTTAPALMLSFYHLLRLFMLNSVFPLFSDANVVCFCSLPDQTQTVLCVTKRKCNLI